MNELDRFIGVKSQGLQAWSERISYFFLVIMIAFAPHSIAISQGGWGGAMLFWLVSLAIGLISGRSLTFRATFLLVPLVALFAWTALSAFLSYAPDISIGKLNAASLFTVFVLIVNMVKTRRSVALVACLLCFSFSIAAVWTPLERVIGRGLEVVGVERDGALAKAGAIEGDTLLEVNGRKVSEPADLLSEIEREGRARIRFYRPDFYEYFEVKKADLADAGAPEEKLGFSSWKRSRNWRSAGFLGHYATFAELTQLIGSLFFGLLAAALYAFLSEPRNNFAKVKQSVEHRQNSVNFRAIILLGAGAAFVLVAMLLTVTRASQAALLFSGLLIGSLTFGRKVAIALLILAIPAGAIGVAFMQRSRNVTLIDQQDNSTTWRQTVFREGLELWTESPRNFLVGVGMDSIKRYAGEWGLFDNGRLPMGHFHSTPLQLAVERGLPALLIWIWILLRFWRKVFASIRENSNRRWIEKGVLLGSFGGVMGFALSGLVHYNLGDSEVALVFYVLVGISSLIVEHKWEEFERSPQPIPN